MSTVTAVPLQPVKRGYLLWLWAGILAAVVAAAALATVGVGTHTTKSGLVYKVTKRGTGAQHPTDSDVALVNYVGRLGDGTVFDKSQQPTPMPVSGVVPGFSEALKLMTKGEHARFWLKPSLGYGASPPPNSPIKANSTLIFDVELIDFLPQQVLMERMREQQMMQGMMGGAGGAGAAGQAGPGAGQTPPPVPAPQ